MTEKRFKVHTVWFNPEKTDGEHTIKDGGQPLITTKSLEDAKFMKGLLNDLFREYGELKKYTLYLESVLEDNEILYSYGDFE